jgi:hypothetical protein
MYISIWYYITFALMMLMSFLQWQKLKATTIKSSRRQQRRKHQLVTLAFGVSYLVRAGFNTTQYSLG